MYLYYSQTQLDKAERYDTCQVKRGDKCVTKAPLSDHSPACTEFP